MAFNAAMANPLMRQRVGGLGGLGGNMPPGLNARPPLMPPMSMGQLSPGRNINRMPIIKAPFGQRVTPPEVRSPMFRNMAKRF